jgi:hypothetical protein
MAEILSLSPNFQGTLAAATKACIAQSPFAGPLVASPSTVSDSLPDPWNVALGGVSIKIEWLCDCGCLFYRASIKDRFDFDFMWFMGHRDPWGDIKTFLVRAAQEGGRCGWKEFFLIGEYCDMDGVACFEREIKKPPFECK